MSRLLGNTKLSNTVAIIVSKPDLVTEHSLVNIDHSDFNGLVALVFAVQTGIGRALPIFQETNYSGKLSARADAPKRTKYLRAQFEALTDNETKRTITSLKALRAQLGFWLKLVFDRGFGNKDILKFLDAQQATFYIRLKASRYIEITGQGNGVLFPIKRSKYVDELVTIAGRKLRVIRSPKNGKNDEPWYILTNDLRHSRNKVVRIYYHRFEIEETFRDIKPILGLDALNLPCQAPGFPSTLSATSVNVPCARS
jgi:hypothetical protein